MPTTRSRWLTKSAPEKPVPEHEIHDIGDGGGTSLIMTPRDGLRILLRPLHGAMMAAAQQ